MEKCKYIFPLINLTNRSRLIWYARKAEDASNTSHEFVQDEESIETDEESHPNADATSTPLPPPDATQEPVEQLSALAVSEPAPEKSDDSAPVEKDKSAKS